MRDETDDGDRGGSFVVSPVPIAPPQKPPGPWRRLLGVPLGLTIEVVLCVACGFLLNAIDPDGLFLLFGVAQALPAIPIAILCWTKDLKATAITLAVSSAVVLLLIGGGGALIWVACAQGGRIGG